MRDTRIKDSNLETMLVNFSDKLANGLEELQLSKNLLTFEGIQVLVTNANKIKILSIISICC